MTTRKTLALNPEAASDTAPALNKKGRGWKISDKRLDELHDRARDMRRHASPAHKALAAKFATANFGRYTFKRFAVVGSAIVDLVAQHGDHAAGAVRDYVATLKAAIVSART